MKVKKSAKKQIPPARDVAALIERISAASDQDLVHVLQQFQSWRYPRGDLHAWIPVLDRSDSILEDIIKSYDLTKLQVNDFTPKTKELLLEVLRVQKLLLENCTNRKLFASYDRLADLLQTNDLDVLHSAIFVILRPAQNYQGHVPLEPPLRHTILHRLLTLSRGWEKLIGAGWDLATLASVEDINLPEALCTVQVQYYPTSHPSEVQEETSPGRPTMSQLETPTRPRHALQSQKSSSSTPMIKSKSSTASQAGPSVVDLGNVALSFSTNYTDQLSVLAEEHHIGLEDQYVALHKLRLVILMGDRPSRRRMLAIRFLALATYVQISSEDASQSGLFLYEPELVTQLADVLRAASDVGEEVATASTLALDACAHHRAKTGEVMTALCANVNHGVIISLFRKVVEHLVRGDEVSFELIDASMTLLAFIASSPMHSNMLMGAGILAVLLDMLGTVGINRAVIIPRAAGLIESIIFSNPQALSNFSSMDGVNALVHRVKAEIELRLKSTLESVSEFMLEETLIISFNSPLRSILRPLQHLMQASGGTEGLRNLVDSDFPRSLKRIFENSATFGPRVYAMAINTMATFVHNEPTSLAILQEMQLPQVFYAQLESGVPPSYEVISSACNAIGAVCLNPAGLDHTLAHPKVITNLVNTIMSTTHEYVFNERDNARHLGSLLDELARHHPALRPVILQASLGLLRQATDAGIAFEPEESQRREYFLDEMAQNSNPPIDDVQRSQSPPSNTCLSTFSRVSKVLSGLLRNAAIAKDFITNGGLDLLLGIADLPCLPIRFGATDAANSLAHLLKHIGEHSHIQLIDSIVASIQEAMNRCIGLWKDDAAPSRWDAMHAGTADDDVRKQFKTLRSLAVRLTFLSEALFALSFSHARIATSIIKALGVTTGSTFLEDLGQIHRVCFQHHVTLRTTKSGVSDSAAGWLENEEIAAAPTPNTSDDPTKESGAKYLATRLHAVLAKFFRAIIKLLFVKRNPEPAHVEQARALADRISFIIIAHLERTHDASASMGIDTVALGLVIMLLFDGRGTDGHLNTTLFLSFERNGGFDRILVTSKRIVSQLDVSTAVEANNRDQAQKDAYIAAMSGLKIVLHILCAFVSAKSLLENPETHAIEQRQPGRKEPVFSSTKLFVKLRLAVFPVAQHIWEATWLLESPMPILKLAVRCFSMVMAGKHESPIEAESSNAGPPIVAHQPRPSPVTADPARVNQLVDMGFPRGAAERALLRTRNNVTAATDLILSMPHVFHDEPLANEPPHPQPSPGDVNASPPTVNAMDDQPVAEPASEVARMEPDPTPEVLEETFVQAQAELTKLRDDFRPQLPSRALSLLDHAEDLVFDLLPCFPSGEQGVTYLLERLLDVSSSYEASRDGAISARLRLLALYLRLGEGVVLDESMLSKAAEVLANLPMENEPRARWLSALFLFAESIFASSTAVTKVKIGDDPELPVTRHATSLATLDNRLSAVSTKLVAAQDASREELMGGLRLLALLSRQSESTTNHTEKAIDALKSFKDPSDKLAGCHPLLVMIVRHAFEDPDTLTDIMQGEIRQWLSPTRNKVTDIQHFVRQLRPAALRQPTCFVRAVEQECALVDSTPPQSVYHIRSRDENKDTPAAPPSTDPFRETGDAYSSHPVIDHILLELSDAVRVCVGTAEHSSALPPTQESQTHALSYSGLLMSLLTELLGSYAHAKKAFMASLRNGRLVVSNRSRGNISTLINDLICCVGLQPDLSPDTDQSSSSVRRVAISSWASSVVVALCSDITPIIGQKDTSEFMVSVRKTVLDAILKGIRETTAILDLSVRYGRLWSLGQLIYRLLMARPTAPNRQGNDSGLHMAKTMLEKNFVGVMTTALGEIDLNYPGVRIVLVTLLRALEHLSKLSVKWGKASKESQEASKNRPIDDEESASTSATESDLDVDMIEEDQAAPDLYRNSALGMIGGELGDEDEDDDGDEDEEDDDMDMGDDLSDGEDGTDTDTSDDESMASHMDNDDWTDELADGDEDTEGDEYMDQEVLLGSGENEDAEIWEDVPDDHESFTSDGQEDDDDNEIHAEGFFGDDGDHDDMDMEDEAEEFDQIEMLESFPNATQSNGFGRQSPDLAGPWGWDQPGNRSSQGSADRRQQSILSEHNAAVSLFGAPQPRSSMNLAQHPLVTNPSSQPAIARGLPRSFGNNYNDLMSAIEDMGGSDAVQMLETLIASRQLAGSDAIRIEVAQDQTGIIGLSVGGRTFAFNAATQRLPTGASSAPTPHTAHAPLTTLDRWQVEMNLCTVARNESASRLVVHLINRLMPEARHRAQEEEARIKQADADAAKAEAEAETKGKSDGITASAALAESHPSPSPIRQTVDDDVPMHDTGDEIDQSEAQVASADENVTESLARTIISIHGQDVDITDTGIDLEFLQALPDDMRADVVEQYLGEQNRQRRPAPDTVPETALQINSEFLDALPPDIRAEVIMQEAMETARRNQPQAQTAAVGAPSLLGGPTGFLSNLTDELRDVMLLGQPHNARIAAPPRGFLGGPPLEAQAESSQAASKPHREAIQLLDKPGIASLVRLLFFPQTLKKGHLFKVMVNLCENTNTRTDLLNLLLSVVQDGSGDLLAVDRSFQQMSLRGVSTPRATPKGKNVDSPATVVLPIGLFGHLQTEHVPTFIAQRCFEALVYIVNSNNNAVSYFLTEHEQPVGLRKHTSRKGKGKEKMLPQTKFPIVVLLGLLERPLLAKTPGMMETVTSLLATITRPLLEFKSQTAVSPSSLQGESIPHEGNADIATNQIANEDNDVATNTESPQSDNQKSKKSTPVIPPPVLRLIVNCLTSGDCTRATFSQTLVVMQNLACLPDARDVILLELRARCHDLGATVQEQLAELASTLKDKTADVGPLTLAKFSPPTSAQAQLLRLLKTIDYLHLNKVDSDAPMDEMTDEERAVSVIFETFDFDTLWTHLGDCLTLIETRETSDQIAMVLLPLVEGLMVVSKYRSRTQRETRSPSLNAPGADNSDLFVSFTTAHRKVLNTIVRNNPSLLSGSFSLLIRNPRVLEFDNKRNWFFQKLKRKRDATVVPSVLHLNIRRQYVFEDSFRALQRKTGDEIKYGKLSVKFHHEDGVDAGGVTREWYSVLAQQIFDPNFALFEPCAADKQTYQPNKASSVNDEHLSYFKFVGRVIGKAVYDGRLLDAYFNRAFYKQILGRTVDMRDLESIDPEYHKSLQWMLDNDITGVIDQEFTTEDDQFGEKKIVELKELGARIPVTEENKDEYVRLVVSYRLDNSIKDQIKAFLEGFYEIIPPEIIQIFEPDQLELLISGITTVDVDELKNATQMSGWKPTDPEISWFWRALRSFSQEERSRFLMFVTSSSRVPLGGFTQLQGSSGTQPFQIQKLYAKEGSLPQASTCFNLLLLPTYASYEQLRERLQFAITETGGFGKA